MNSHKQAALEYAKRGWAVFPCYWIQQDGSCSCSGKSKCKPGKHPAVAKGFKDATTELKVIANWWDYDPESNIGIATGKVSGIFVLDVDGEIGAESLETLETKYGPLPHTVEAISGGGGRHIYFQYVEGIGSFTNLNIGLEDKLKLDIRGDGGYILAEPSNHKSGNIYEWELTHHPDETPLAEAPSWLIDLILNQGNSRKKLRLQSQNHSHKRGVENFSLEEVEKMLSYIPQVPGYDIWRNICWGIAEYCVRTDTPMEDGIELIRNWSDDDQNGKVVEGLFKSNNGSIDIATVIHHAQENGYKLPIKQMNSTNDQNLQTVGSTVLTLLYNNGEGYKTIHDKLHAYKDGFYQELQDDREKQRITEFLRTYETSWDKKKGAQYIWSTTWHTNEAFKYIKSFTSLKSGEIINPPGINLKNGYLRMEKDILDIWVFKLVDHSPDYIFTYKSNVSYDSKADSRLFDETFRAIIQDPDQRKIFIRLLGSTLNLPEIRKRHGRDVRALFLVGEGANGKDTLREWTYLLLGGFGVTSVGLQAFKQADANKLFSMPPLEKSLINWPSENANVLLDSCETLKRFITGEEIHAAYKGKDEFTFRCKGISIFNTNHLPRIYAEQTANTSRYAIIEFKTSFVNKPNQNNPYESLANPRFKEDSEFIIEHILPAFLNHIIKGFYDAFAYGIDYSCNTKLIHHIHEENNHLASFIRDFRIEQCDPSKGIQTTILYENFYIKWCRQQGLVIEDRVSNNRRYNHPHEKYDKVVTNVRQFTSKLKTVFPNLDVRESKNFSTLGLRVTQPEVISSDIPSNSKYSQLFKNEVA